MDPKNRSGGISALNNFRAHRIDVMVVTGTKLNNSRALSLLLVDYEQIMSPCQPGGKGDVVVLSRKSLGLQVCTVFIDPESRLVVLDMTDSGNSFRLVGVYTPI